LTTEPEDPEFDGDIFAEDYKPGLAFAVIAAKQAEENHALAVRRLAECHALHGTYANPVAASGRKAGAQVVAEMADAAALVGLLAAKATADAVAHVDYAAALSEALEAAEAAERVYAELDAPLRAMTTPDVEPVPVVEEPLPQTSDWATVAGQTARETADWAVRVRGKQGQLAIIKPSPSTGKPLHEDTLITMADGARKPIKEIVVGDRVISGAGRVTSVAAVYDQGVLDVIRLTTRAGREVIAEATHQFLVTHRKNATERNRDSGRVYEWRQGGDIIPYDRNASRRPRGHSLVARFGYERSSPTSVGGVHIARLLGYFIGDGSVTGKSCRFTNTDPVVIARFTAAVAAFDPTCPVRAYESEPITFVVGSRTRRSESEKLARLKVWTRRRRRGIFTKHIYRKNPVKELLRRHGVDGCGAYEKRAPISLFTAPTDEICEFIAAYFECDGTRMRPAEHWRSAPKGSLAARPPAASFSSVSRDLLADVQTLLTRLGIRSQLRRKNGRYNGQPHLSWRLSILDLARFFDVIPVNGKKSGQADASRRREPHSGLLEDAVMSIAPAGRARCLCITVADDESFLANDVITHNTQSQISVALQEQQHRQRVIFAARTKEMLTEELEPRIRAKNPYVRLHVITGRDEVTCLNWQNVHTVQDHGYAPGRAVCFECPNHPKHAVTAGLRICPYYETRIRAQNDSKTARRHLNDYPLILTTHAGLVCAFESGGGMFGKFWSSDLMLIDEDPTAAFEPTVTVTAKHCEFKSGDPLYHAQTLMAALLQGAISQAQLERAASQSRGFKDIDGNRNPIHRREDSLYAARILHDLLMRVATGPVGQGLGIASLKELLRNATDFIPAIGSGSLLGAETTDDVNLLAPHAGLGRIAELLFTELALRDSIKIQLYERARGHGINQGLAREQIDAEIDRNVDVRDTVYQTRLEWTAEDGWRFVLQDFTNLHDHVANIAVGDAYAHVDHYRQLFGKPATPTGDPVTVIERVAHFPQGALVVRVKTKSNISWLLKDGWTHHASLIASLLPQFAGKKVLIYGHKSIYEKFKQLMDANANFGIEQWEFEHWWGGRGKDQYRTFDAVVCITEPIQNVNGMLHIVNARALRDLTRHASTCDPIVDGMRITSDLYDMKLRTLASAMHNLRTHWRVRLEHERQNVDEMGQAFHRVRGLMGGNKMMVTLGQEIELTRDILAGAAMMLPQRKMSKERGTLRDDVSLDGYLSSEEIVKAIQSVEEQLGVWSPAFNHALISAILEVVLGGDYVRAEIPDLIPILKEACRNPPLEQKLLSHFQLVQRVWAPAPYWDQLNERVRRLGRMQDAIGEVTSSALFRTVGYARPLWWPASQPGRGYTFYSTRPLGAATRIFMDIINNQYGPTSEGRVLAPHARQCVPF